MIAKSVVSELLRAGLAEAFFAAHFRKRFKKEHPSTYRRRRRAAFLKWQASRPPFEEDEL